MSYGWESLFVSFLCGGSIDCLRSAWKELQIPQHKEVQIEFVKSIVFHPLVVTYPPSAVFIYKTLKTLFVEIDLCNGPISEELQSAYEYAIDRLSQDSVQHSFHYCHFFILKPDQLKNDSNKDSQTKPRVKEELEASQIISEFLTYHEIISLRVHDRRNEVGLRLWRAAFVLSDLLIRLGQEDLIAFGVKQKQKNYQITIEKNVDTDQYSSASMSSEKEADSGECTIKPVNAIPPNSMRFCIPSCKGRRALELGAGVGLTSVIAAKYCQLDSLNLTDYLPLVLNNLIFNLANLNQLTVAQVDAAYNLASTRASYSTKTGVGDDNSDDSDSVIPRSTSSDTGDSRVDTSLESLTLTRRPSSNDPKLITDQSSIDVSNLSMLEKAVLREPNFGDQISSSHVVKYQCPCGIMQSEKNLHINPKIDPVETTTMIPTTTETFRTSISSHEFISKKIVISLLDWESFDEQNIQFMGCTARGNSEPVDMIFASDTIYDEALTKMLIITISKLLQVSNNARKNQDKTLQHESINHFKPKSWSSLMNGVDRSNTIVISSPFVLLAVTERNSKALEVFLDECQEQNLQVIRLYIQPFENYYLKDPNENDYNNQTVRIYLLQLLNDSVNE